MNIYQAQDLDLEPIIIMADNEKEAIAKFHWAILKGFGFWPNLNFALEMVEASELPLSDELSELVAKDEPGFASVNEEGWKRVPFPSEA